MSASKQNQILVVGLGNRAHQDEGLGVALATEIQSLNLPNVTVVFRGELGMEDAILLDTYDLAVFVDATRNDAEPFSFHALHHRSENTIPRFSVNPAELVEMSSGLIRSSTQVYLLAIRGYEFEELGDFLSPRARTNLAHAAAYLKSMLHGLNWLDMDRTAGSAQQ